MDIIEIAEQLSAPLRSFRLMAIEEILTKGKGDEVMALLQDRYAVEKDEECHLLLSHALQTLHDRKERAKIDAALESELETFLEYEPLEKLKKLENLSPEQRKGWAETAWNWYEAEKHPIIASVIIRIFSSHWQQAQLKELAKELKTGSLSKKMAILSVLTTVAPNFLLKHLPNLLTSKDPQIQGLAVRGLSKIDLPEAIRHLEYRISHADRNQRLTSIKASVHFRYSDIKEILLKALIIEEDPGLIEKLGMLFEINPDTEMPYRLWDLAETSPPQKAELIKKIYQNSLQLLIQLMSAGLDAEAYQDRLQKWIQQRNARKNLQEKIFQNEPQEEQATQAASGDAKISEAFPDSPSESFSKEVKRRLSVASQSASEDSTPAPEEDPVPEQLEVRDNEINDFEKALALSEEEKIRLFAGYSKASQPVMEKLTKSIVLDTSRNSPNLCGTALKYACKTGMTGFTKLAEKWLRSHEESLITASINYLHRVDTELLIPHLGKFLQEENVRIRVAAISILKGLDFKQSLSYMDTMLKNPNPKIQEAGLSCLVKFDFALVRDLLIKFLAKDIDEALFEIGLFLFQTNIAVENLYCLYQLEKKLLPPRSEMVKTARNLIAKNLESSGILTSKAIEDLRNGWEERYKQEHAQKTNLKPYSVKNLHPKTDGDVSENLFKFIQENPKVQYALGALLICFLIFSLMSIVSNAFSNMGSSRGNSGANTIKMPQLQLSGNALERSPDDKGVIFQSFEGKKYYLVGEQKVINSLIGKGTQEIIVADYKQKIGGLKVMRYIKLAQNGTLAK